jgi:hypothetical protein
MRHFLVLLGALVLLAGCAPSRASVEKTSLCEHLLPDVVQSIHYRQENGEDNPHTIDAEHRWYASCREHPWNQAVVHALDPAQPRTLPDPPGWRDYLRAAGEGIQRGLDAPMTTCRTSPTHGRNGSGLVTNCMTW